MYENLSAVPTSQKYLKLFQNVKHSLKRSILQGQSQEKAIIVTNKKIVSPHNTAAKYSSAYLYIYELITLF